MMPFSLSDLTVMCSCLIAVVVPSILQQEHYSRAKNDSILIVTISLVAVLTGGLCSSFWHLDPWPIVTRVILIPAVMHLMMMISHLIEVFRKINRQQKVMEQKVATLVPKGGFVCANYAPASSILPPSAPEGQTCPLIEKDQS